MSSLINTQNSIINLSNRIEINDSLLDSILNKIDKKKSYKRITFIQNKYNTSAKKRNSFIISESRKIKYNWYPNNKKSRLYYYKLRTSIYTKIILS